MTDALWDPQRLATIASIVGRYASHIEVGDRIRLLIEGDTCRPVYRRSADGPPPAGTIVSIDRSAPPKVSFDVELDAGQGRTTLHNFPVLPDECWEVEPAYIPTFRGRVLGVSPEDEDDEAAPRGGEDEERLATPDFARHGSAAAEADTFRRIDQLESTVDALRQVGRTTNGASADTIFNLAAELGEVIRRCGYEDLTFATDLSRAYEERFRGAASPNGCGGHDDGDADGVTAPFTASEASG